jgi:hypothetical protein
MLLHSHQVGQAEVLVAMPGHFPYRTGVMMVVMVIYKQY